MMVLEILERARELIATPERWMQMVGARKANGEHANWGASDAVCHCLYASLCVVSGDVFDDETEQAIVDAFGLEDIGAVIRWNDAPERTHVEVLALLDTTIARLKAATP